MKLVVWANAVAKRELAGSLPQRWSHVQGVQEKVGRAAILFNSEEQEMLLAAAVLHDVGYAPEIADTGFHSLDGANYLRSQQAPARLCALVAHHSCAYREAELRGLTAELASWVDEATPLRDALWWADMTTTPDGEPTDVHSRIGEIEKRYGPEDLVTFFIRQAKHELVGAVERTEERLRAAGVDYTAK